MECNVIRDLLPLYTEGLTGDTSNEMIEAHLKECPECAHLLEQMQTPMEQEPMDEDAACTAALRVQERKRKRRTILTIVLAMLVCTLGWWIYMETHFYGERIITVSTDGSEILEEMPDLALTDAEKAQANTILEVDLFREALSLDAGSYGEFDLEAIRSHIAPALPEDAVITSVSYVAATIVIDYRVGDLRTILEYTDADLTGHVDAIRKVMAYSPSEYVNGVELAGDVDEVFMVTHAVGAGITQYEKTESQHIWFSFMDMP